MQTVTVKTAELLAKVRENREQHRAIFEKALEGYRRTAVAHLESMLTDAKAGRKIERALRLVEPMDQTRDYDRIIAMLEMSVDAEIELSQSEFAMYAMDDWSWKQQFTTTTQGYL